MALLLSAMSVGAALGGTPVPARLISNGFSLASLLAICSTALAAPNAVGENCTVKVAKPGPGTGANGKTVRVNSAESGPSIVIPKPVRSALPVLRIVKDKLAVVPAVTLPKLLVPPSGIFVPRG